MSRQKTSEWCGVVYCPNPSRAKGLCSTHHKQYTQDGLHTQVVATDEINRLVLKQPAYSRSYYVRRHRQFARSLPIPKQQQLALTKSLNAIALRRGVVK